MRYTGTQLNQYDADVFFEVLQRARRTPLGTGTTFAGADFLRSIGRTASKSDYEDMDMSLRRLARGLVDVKWRLTNNRTVEYTGSLVAEFIRETDSRLYRVNLAPAIKSLFEPNSFTMIEWEQRKRLLRNPLAQWLHSYYSTHANPFPVKVQFLQKMAGQESARTRDFAKALRVAFGILEAELQWTVQWLSPDLVQVTHPPSESQARHLEVRAARKKLKDDATAAAKRRTITATTTPTAPHRSIETFQRRGDGKRTLTLASLFRDRS